MAEEDGVKNLLEATVIWTILGDHHKVVAEDGTETRGRLTKEMDSTLIIQTKLILKIAACELQKW